MIDSIPIHVYVAGPYRADTAWKRERNIRRAEEAGFRLAEHGLIPVIPHTMYRHFDGELTDEFWLAATNSLLERCDALVLLPDWKDSAGSKGEHNRAFEMSMPIFDDSFDDYGRPGVALAAEIRQAVSERRSQ